MTCATTALNRLHKLDREQDLMKRLIEQRPPGPRAEPNEELAELLSAFDEAGILINHCDHGVSLHSKLCAVLVAGADLAHQFGISPYDADEWPDGYATRIGGDGAYATGHPALELLSELREAVAWVVKFVHDRTEPVSATVIAASGVSLLCHDAEPTTELFARVWSLADGVAAREPLRQLVQDHLSAQANDQPPSTI